MSLPVAVLISGRGSNMKALLEACSKPEFPAHIALVISNNNDAYGIDIAHEYGVKTEILSHKHYDSRAEFDAALDRCLMANDVKMVCLAGFMRLLGREFVENWNGKLINVHPSLLPAFKGLDTHARALEKGVKLHGCTVHYVSPEMDEGPIIGQAAIPVRYGDDKATLADRVLEAEHQLYPACLESLALGQITLKNGRVIVSLVPGSAAKILLNRE
ncbi:MAG: phosphoribosylglycinamide formyltransferase [Robiginitomaculum sp.]|nr:MAG: phosphoribosylglycinamide formyltransferase [Robiginitomaculum sp.]